MWEPPPEWVRLPGGPSTTGLWRVPGGKPCVAKRLSDPSAAVPVDGEQDPSHLAWWRREADVASSGVLDDLPGLCSPRCVEVAVDAEGVTLVHAEVERSRVPPDELAHHLGRFGAGAVDPRHWMLVDQLAQRLRALERRGGWSHLARTPAADLVNALWRRRRIVLERWARAPGRGPVHGDLTVENVLTTAPDGRVVVADWAGFGTGPWGHDLGYYALSAAVPVEELLEPYLRGLAQVREDEREVEAARPEVLFAARANAAFACLSRADWALGRVAPGEGALVAKMRHPAVAVHLRAVERQERAITALLQV